MRKVILEIDHRIGNANIRDWDSNEVLWTEIFTDKKSLLKFAEANGWKVYMVTETHVLAKKPGLLERALKLLRGNK